jgi:hypothetical protein
VNLPQCFWLDGASNPDITMTLPLAGQPGPGGQTVQYQFVVSASRSHTQLLDLGLRPITVRPPDMSVIVGQLEGIPQS